jgi:uncharacterized OB-fold protein
MSEVVSIPDWTTGQPSLVYQHCGSCAGVWYFRRTFCPNCGAMAVVEQASAGIGTVHAATLVTRAPSDDLRSYTPYLIVLVDADEGFRLMAHGERSLQIGDRVRCRFTALAGKLIPHFDKMEQA